MREHTYAFNLNKGPKMPAQSNVPEIATPEVAVGLLQVGNHDNVQQK